MGVTGIRLRLLHGGGLQAGQAIEARIHAFNTLQNGLHNFTARQLLAMNGLGKFIGAEFGNNHA
jgi:hypothetical protein